MLLLPHMPSAKRVSSFVGRGDKSIKKKWVTQMPQYVVTITQNDAASVHSKSMMLLLYVGQCGGPGGRLY